ncbi:Rho GTPase-activating [Pleurotus pulmonarius]
MRKGRLEDPEHMHAPTKASLKAWWQSFTFAQKMKKDSESAALNKGEPVHTVFGKPLKESLKYANVQISTANANGELYVWGYIPVVVAKCGLFLKENATEVEGVFRVNGSAKRMRELQAAFETPPRYGKSLDWKQETYTPHDVASVFRRYLTQMPEPVIPHNLYHEFRAALAKIPNHHNEVISTYKHLIRSMPRANQYLLLYVLDLLSVFARKSDKNRMTATNLAVIFRPGIISHPTHEMLPNEHHLSQKVLEFLIEHQDWFMLDIPPPPQGPEVDERGSTGAGSGGSQPTAILRPGFGGRRTGDGGGGDGHGLSSSGSGLEDHDLHIIPSSDEERDHSSSVSGGWKLIVRGERGDKEGQGKVHRRRTLASPTTPTRPTSGRRDRGDGGVLQEESLTPPGGSPGVEDGGLSPVAESPTGERGFGFAGALGVSRSRTLPTGRRRGPGEDGGGSRGLEKGSEKDRARVLRKQKRASSSQSRVPTTGALQIDTSHSAGR